MAGPRVDREPTGVPDGPLLDSPCRRRARSESSGLPRLSTAVRLSRIRLTDGGAMTGSIWLRMVTDARLLIAMAVATATGLWGTSMWPWQSDHVLLSLIAREQPTLGAVLAYSYATLWFTTPFFAANVVLSALTIFTPRLRPGPVTIHLPVYPDPKARPSLCLVLGEQHQRATAAPVASPGWLTIPERGALRRHRRHRGDRDRKDLGVSLSVPRATLRVLRGGRGPEGRRRGPRGQRRLLP